jgi:ABC-2 type transport system ATP-binding protein
MAKGKTIVETRGLTKKYGQKVVVNNLNLSIGAGEVFGLLGPNGAGKTTTILMLLGLTEPAEGSAYIDGQDCTRRPIEVKRVAGYLPDNVGFYGDMTGRENLRFMGRLNGLPDKLIERRIDTLLDRVGIAYAADQRAGAYSKGMKQRLGIADVLMKDPKVVILDEPTLGIDPEGIRELMELIRELAAVDGRTVLISSHQLYQVQQVCDRVGIFVGGNLIAGGRIEELSKQIESDGTHMTEFAAAPDNAALERRIRSLGSVEDISREGDGYVIRSSADIRGPLVSSAVQDGYTVLRLRLRGGDLDEIYRRYFEKET